MRGELEGVRQQVLQHLLQPLRVGDDAAAQAGIDVHLERQAAAFGFVPEGAADGLEQVGEEHLLGLDRDRAGLDLRQVENVGDQIQQVGAGAMNGAGELDLLRGEVAFGVVGQLLAENQDAVERRAQLVRHVGEELRLVLRGQRQLRGLLFDGAPRLLDFLILALDLDVLLGQLLRLLRQLLVGLLQFPLLGLQLGGQLLRLLEQPLGLHRGFDAVDQDADIRGQLLEKRQVHRAEVAERGQAEDRLHLPLEDDRKHDQAARQRGEQWHRQSAPCRAAGSSPGFGACRRRIARGSPRRAPAAPGSRPGAACRSSPASSGAARLRCSSGRSAPGGH